MKRLFFALFLLPALAQATPSLEDAFYAYSNTRKLEQQVALLPAQADLNPDERITQARELDAALTEARIAFHAVLRSDREKLDPWETDLLEKVAAKKKTNLTELNPEHLRYLQASFPEAQNFSPLEWAVLEEWFGRPTQEAFLHWAFQAHELKAEKEENKAKLLVLADPFRRTGRKGSPTAEELKRRGHEVEVLELSAFTKLDDLAEDLRRALTARDHSPAFLVSEGNGSALVLRMLDLYPRMRRSPALAGWVNVDGRLFGEKAQGKSKQEGRSLASVSEARDPALRMEREARAGLDSLRWESLERPAPLGEGFPIVNLVSKKKGAALRESLVTEAQTWLVKDAPLSRVGDALRSLSRPFSRP